MSLKSGNLANRQIFSEQLLRKKTKNEVGRLIITAVIVIIFCICVAGTIEAQRSGIEEGEIYVQRTYVKTALVHQWRLKRDYVTPTALLKTVIMAQEGRSKNEIITAVTKLREEHDDNVRAGLRREWQVSEDYRAMIRHVGGLAGVIIGRYSQMPGISEGTNIISDLGIKTYERLARDEKVIEASKKIGLTYQNLAGAEENIAKLVVETWRTNRVFRDVYSEQFEPILQIRPTDSIEEINRNLPHLLIQNNVARILEVVSNRPPVAGEDMVRLNGEVTNVLHELRSRQQQEQSRARTDLEKNRERVKREGLRAGVFLATATIGLIDPELGKQAQAVSSAAFQVNDAIREFKAATDLGKDLTGAAGMALTANFVGAAFTLVGAFQDSGPSPEEIILEEIVELRKDIQNVRMEMHDRFGIVERKLAMVYDRLDEGFKDLETELRKQNRTLNRIVSKLEEMQDQISASTALIFDRTLILEELIKELKITDCINWKERLKIDISDKRYGECLLQMQALFSLSYLEKRQIKRKDADLSENLSRWLREKPNEMATISLISLNELSRLENLPDTIPGPIDWKTAAETYMDFLEDWPTYRNLARNNGFGLDELMNGAKKVSVLRSTVQRQLKAFSTGTPNSAIEKLLASVLNRKNTLSDAIQRYEEKYYKEVLGRSGIKELGSIKIEPINEEVRCPFHTETQPESFEGRGYIADPPPKLSNHVPPFVRQLVLAGIGKVEYCLEIFYRRGRTSRSSLNLEHSEILLADAGWNMGQPKILLVNIELNIGQREILLTDTEGIQYYMSSGPYTMILRIDYVLDSLKCGPPLNQSKVVQILKLSAEDEKEVGGSTSYSGSSVPPTRVVAPRNIWDSKWRDKFLRLISFSKNEDAEQCLKKHLTSRLKERWAEMEHTMSEWIGKKLLEDKEIRLADIESETDYALLSHWIWSGYADAARESDLLARLIQGTASGPTLASAVAGTLVQKEAALVWEAPEWYLAGLNALKQVLQSEEIKEAFERSQDNFGVNELTKRIEDFLH